MTIPKLRAMRMEVAIRLRFAREIIREAGSMAAKHPELLMAAEQLVEVSEDISTVMRILVKPHPRDMSCED